MPDDTPAALTLGNPDHCRGGHPTIRSVDGGCRPPAAFGFGRGRTEMDQFVRHVTGGNPPEYAEQWSRTEWAIAFECSLHLEDGQGKLCPCAPVPEWLPDVVNEHISFSYDLPYPAIGWWKIPRSTGSASTTRTRNGGTSTSPGMAPPLSTVPGPASPSHAPSAAPPNSARTSPHKAMPCSSHSAA